MPQASESSALHGFVEGFIDQYEDLRNLRRGDGPPIVVPSARHVDPDTEVKRAYWLADRAARQWAPWSLEAIADADHIRARARLARLPEVIDHDSASDAEGWLSVARDDTVGYSRLAVSHAREAATAAAEIDLDLVGVDNSGAVRRVARAAGEALAAAGITAGKPAEAVAEVAVVLERLQ